MAMRDNDVEGNRSLEAKEDEDHDDDDDDDETWDMDSDDGIEESSSKDEDYTTTTNNTTYNVVDGDDGYNKKNINSSVLDTIDLCMTCVSKTPPKLPLREELISLGIEMIYNAKGAGQKAASKERDLAATAAAKKRRKKTNLFVLLKLKNNSSSSSHPNEKHQLVAISYEKYLEALQRNSDLPAISSSKKPSKHETKKSRGGKRRKKQRRKDSSSNHIVDEVNLTPECFERNFLKIDNKEDSPKQNQPTIKSKSLSFFGKKSISHYNKIADDDGNDDDDETLLDDMTAHDSCGSQYTTRDDEDYHRIPILQYEDEDYNSFEGKTTEDHHSSVPTLVMEDPSYYNSEDDEEESYYQRHNSRDENEDDNVIMMSSTTTTLSNYDDKKNNRSDSTQRSTNMAQLNVALEQSLERCTYRNSYDELDEYEKQIRMKKEQRQNYSLRNSNNNNNNRANTNSSSNAMLLHTIHTQVFLSNHFDDNNNSTNTKKSGRRGRSQLYATQHQDDVVPPSSLLPKSSSNNFSASKSLAKGTFITLLDDDAKKPTTTQNCYSLGKMTGQLGIRLDPNDKYLLKTALLKNSQVPEDDDDEEEDAPSSPPKDIIVSTDLGMVTTPMKYEPSKTKKKKGTTKSISPQANKFLQALVVEAATGPFDSHDHRKNNKEEEECNLLIKKVVSDDTDDVCSEMSMDTFLTGQDVSLSDNKNNIVSKEELVTLDNELVHRMLMFHENNHPSDDNKKKRHAFQTIDGTKTYLIPQQPCYYSYDEEEDYSYMSASWRSFSESDDDTTTYNNSIVAPYDPSSTREIVPFTRTSSSLSSQQTESDILLGDDMAKCDSPPSSPCDVMDESVYRISTSNSNNTHDSHGLHEKQSRNTTHTTVENSEMEDFSVNPIVITCDDDDESRRNNNGVSIPHEDGLKSLFPSSRDCDASDTSDNDNLVSVILSGLSNQCGKSFNSSNSEDSNNSKKPIGIVPTTNDNEVYHTIPSSLEDEDDAKDEVPPSFSSDKINDHFPSMKNSKKRSLSTKSSSPSSSDRNNGNKISSKYRVHVEASHTFLETIMENESVTNDDLPLRVKKGKSRKSCPIMV